MLTPGVGYSALVSNMRGFHGALKAGMNVITIQSQAGQAIRAWAKRFRLHRDRKLSDRNAPPIRS